MSAPRCEARSERSDEGRCLLEPWHNGPHEWSAIARGRHVMQLRPDVMVAVEVPFDLTMTEAHRVADFVRGIVTARRTG
jgi:hypothetical protein